MAGHHATDDSTAEIAAELPDGYRWVLLLGVWLIYASFGMAVVSLAPLVLAITRDFGIGHASMGLVFGAWQLMFIVFAVPASGLLDRIGVRRGLFLASLTIAASGFLRSLSPGYWSLLAAVAVLGIGGPLVSTGAPKVVARWFRGQDRGFAMGVYITGPAFGGILALSLSNSILMPAFGGDWRRVLQVWSVVALLAGFAWLAIAQRPEVLAADAQAIAGHHPRQRDLVRDLLHVPAVQVLLAMSVGIFLFNHGLNNWLPELLRAKGMSPATAGYWATIPTLVGLAGSLTIPRLATPERRYLMLGGLFVAAMVASVMLRADQGTVLVIGLMLQGIARSSMMTVAMLTLVETPGIGERHAATASGMFFTAAEVGGASGPLLIRLIHDASGGFGACLTFLSAITAVLIVGALRLKRIADVSTAARAEA